MTGTAVLYARVSTKGQAERGFSLDHQLDALRKYASQEGYAVLEEVTDAGWSGATIERLGVARVMDLVKEGGVDVVLAQDRDRFARDPVLIGWLKRELKRHGSALRSLQDRADDTPEGELMEGISTR